MSLVVYEGNGEVFVTTIEDEPVMIHELFQHGVSITDGKCRSKADYERYEPDIYVRIQSN